MTTKFKDLDLELVNEGQTFTEFKEQFEALQHELVAYTRQWAEQAKGAKASINLKLTLSIDDPKTLTFGILPEVKVTGPPVSPPIKTFSMGGTRQTGNLGLFVGVTGSHADPPQQAHLEFEGEETETE